MAVFQPAEETGEGAQAMIDDGLFHRFPKPDVVFGQHMMVGRTISGRAGVITFAGDSLQIRLSAAARTAIERIVKAEATASGAPQPPEISR
jgi:metal-dependent amidase/aminoacylase/carboxypeptidase family protein